jgi:type II secretory pathway component GspD/PulD (secretin)
MDVGIEFEDLVPQGTVGAGRQTFMTTDFTSGDTRSAAGFKVLANIPGTASGATVAFLDDGVVNILLKALESKAIGRVLSKPRVLVNNNDTGKILSQDEEPVSSTDVLTTTTTTTTFSKYEPAGTSLEIVPHISDGDFLKLEIKANISAFGVKPVGSPASLPPPKTTRTIETIITVPDQRTIIIGGVTGKSQTESVSQIPLLGDIPLLGELFKRRTTTDQTRTIYLFVKASILRDITFLDAHEETQKARDTMPDALQKLDEALTTPAVQKEIQRLEELRRRRAQERKEAEERAANTPREPELPSGPRVRIPAKLTPPSGPAAPPAGQPPQTGATTEKDKAAPPPAADQGQPQPPAAPQTK